MYLVCCLYFFHASSSFMFPRAAPVTATSWPSHASVDYSNHDHRYWCGRHRPHGCLSLTSGVYRSAAGLALLQLPPPPPPQPPATYSKHNHIKTTTIRHSKSSFGMGGKESEDLAGVTTLLGVLSSRPGSKPSTACWPQSYPPQDGHLRTTSRAENSSRPTAPTLQRDRGNP